MVHPRPSPDAARRNLIKALGAGGIAAVAVALPERWTKAVVESVWSPVHAQASPLPPPPPASCSGTTRHVLSDADFATGWNSQFIMDDTPAGAAQTSLRRADQGNPAASRSTSHTYAGPGGIIVAHWNDETFDPGGQPVGFLSYSLQARKFPWIVANAADMVIRVLLKQGAAFYTSRSIEVQAFDFAWLDLDGSCLQAADFTKQEQTGAQDDSAGATPDFSQPMQFGYATANSTSGTESVADREALVDNFRVEVR